MKRLFLATLVMLFAAAPSPAQPAKALEVVPHDALGFILVKDLRALTDKIDDLARKLKADDYATLLTLIRTEMGLQGVNEKGSAVLLVVKGKKEHSLRPIFAVPIDNRDKMMAALGVKDPKARISPGAVGDRSGLLWGIGGGKKAPGDGKGEDIKNKTPVLVATKGDFALLADPEDRDALEQILDAKKSIADSLKPARDWLDEQDICGVVSQDGVKFGIAMFVAGPTGVFGSSTPGQVEHMKTTFAELEKNVKLIAFGSKVEKEGHARLATRVYFEPDGSYAAWMSKAQPLAHELLARMPDQPYFAAGLARISAQTSFDGVKHAFPAKMPADEAEKLTKEYKQLLQRITEFGGLVYPDKSVKPTRFAALAKVDDSGAFVGETIQVMLHTHQAMQKYDDCKAEVKTEQKRIADKPSWLITVRPAPSDKKEPSSKDASPEESTLLLTELDAKTVLAVNLEKGENPETVINFFSQKQTQALNANRGITDTAALLPKELQVVVYIGMATVMNAKQDTPPMAIALRTLPAGAEAQFVVPFGAMQALFDSIKPEKEKKK